MAQPTDSGLTEAEAELYDRQIRLWGLEAQQRLRKARVLLIGISPTAAEIAKNVVLSGISCLTLMDKCDVKAEDVGVNFLLPKETIGKNRAEAALSRAQELNPMVKLEAKAEDFTTMSTDSIKSFDVVCLTAEGCSRAQLEALNAKCRSAGSKLVITETFGSFGFSFADLLEHEFVEEIVPVPPAAPSTSREEPAAKRRRVDDDEAAVEAETKLVKRSMQFCALGDALDVDWTSATRRQLRRISPVFFIMQALLRSRQEGGDLQAAWKAFAEERKVDEGLLTSEQLSQCSGLLQPLFPIVGGVVAQEIIKTVSQKDPPLQNFFFFNSNDFCGTVNSIGPVEAS